MTDDSKLLRIRPLVVLRSRKAVPFHRAVEAPEVRRQLAAVDAYRAAKGANLLRGLLVQRGDGYCAAADAELKSAIEEATADRHVLVMDDVFRLIDCRILRRALEDCERLVRLEPPIYSLNHRSLLLEMGDAFISLQLRDRATQSALRSRQVKNGLERAAEFLEPPSRKVIEKAVDGKKAKANSTASRLVEEIDRLRARMAAEKRSSPTAIATALNAIGVPTPSGRGKWQGTTVKRVLARVGRSLD